MNEPLSLVERLRLPETESDLSDAAMLAADTIERLTRERDEFRRIVGVCARVEEGVCRERDRLRAALEQITKESFAHIMVSIAREALRGADETKAAQPCACGKSPLKCPSCGKPGDLIPLGPDKTEGAL